MGTPWGAHCPPQHSGVSPSSHPVRAGAGAPGHDAAGDRRGSQGQRGAVGRGGSPWPPPTPGPGVPTCPPISPSPPAPPGAEDDEGQPGHRRGQLCRHRCSHQAAAEVTRPPGTPWGSPEDFPRPPPRDPLGPVTPPRRSQLLLVNTLALPPQHILRPQPRRRLCTPSVPTGGHPCPPAPSPCVGLWPPPYPNKRLSSRCVCVCVSIADGGQEQGPPEPGVGSAGIGVDPRGTSWSQDPHEDEGTGGAAGPPR